MREWREYEKTYRVRIPQFEIPHGKFSLSDKEVRQLLAGEVYITEKLDGANTGFYKKNGQRFPQKRRGPADDSHEQFKFFKNQWMYNNYEKLEQLPDNTVIYGELMRCVHTIYYDKLSDWFIVFDMWDMKKEQYLDFLEVIDICDTIGLVHVPVLWIGTVERKNLYHYIKKESDFGDTSEGIVIKNYKKQLRGKVVKPEFIKFLEEDDHWRAYHARYNKLCEEK